jgi:hypothetical protein
MIHLHKLHLGLYARVAKKAKSSASYVSLIANGRRQNERIVQLLTAELQRIDKRIRELLKITKQKRHRLHSRASPAKHPAAKS